MRDNLSYLFLISCLDLIEVTPEEVTKLLISLDSGKAPVPDNLSTIALNQWASALAPCITAFINSFLNGYCLSAWKTTTEYLSCAQIRQGNLNRKWISSF